MDNIYKKMKPNELALISFKAISTQNSSLMDAIEANVEQRTYVGKHIDYCNGLNNRVSFCVWFGLQYHSVTALYFSARWQLERETNDGGIRVLKDDRRRLFRKQITLLQIANSLCDEYQIDKKTFLALAQINITVEKLAAWVEVDSNLSDLNEDDKKYSDDMRELFENVINRNFG